MWKTGFFCQCCEVLEKRCVFLVIKYDFLSSNSSRNWGLLGRAKRHNGFKPFLKSHLHGQNPKLYSKALRYMALSSTDLAAARLWIGSKTIWDERLYVVRTFKCTNFEMNKFLYQEPLDAWILRWTNWDWVIRAVQIYTQWGFQKNLFQTTTRGAWDVFSPEILSADTDSKESELALGSFHLHSR